MAKIIATAENFAFGPASKLVTVCERLIEEGHEITFVGEGTAYQLASKINFKKIYRHNTDSKSFMTWGEKIFKNADALLSSVDRSSVILAKKVSLPVIWLDMLFWWWDEIPEYLFDVGLYIQQNSVKNIRNMKKYGNKIKNMKIVGPILDTAFKGIPTKKQLLVAFGGTEAAGWYKVGKDTFYPYTFTKLIIDKVNTDKYKTVLFAGNEKIMADLNKIYGNNKFQFRILPHKIWLKELAESEDLLLIPGLETGLDVTAHERPFFMLPPYNSSAYMELDEFRRKGIATKGNSIHFADYFPHRDLSGRNLREIMKEFLEELRVFESSPKILDDCAKRINAYLKLPKSTKALQIPKQRKYLKSYGKNGLTETIKLINEFVKKQEQTKRLCR